MNLSLVPEGSEILNLPCAEWDFDNPIMPAHQFAFEMHRLMEVENGIGLAAPQVGLSTRVFVMRDTDTARTCFNPQIISTSEEINVFEEGCLSFPGLYFKVKRPASVKVKYQDADAKWIEEELDNILARCFQHELSHLNGVCFTDEVSRLTLKMALKRRNKLRDIRSKSIPKG